MKWDSQLYDNRHQFVSRYGSSLIDLLEPEETDSVLDLGCGTGDLAHEIKPHVKTVIGIDASKEMVQKACAKFPDIRFQCAQASNLCFTEQFDAVFSNAVLHWIPAEEQARVLKEVRNHLRKGGRFVAEMGAEGNVQKIRHAVRNTLRERGLNKEAALKIWFFPKEATYRQYLEEAGFRIELIETYDRPTKLADGDQGIMEWLDMFGKSWFAGMEENQKEGILREVRNKLYPDLYRDGHWVADYKRLRFKAIKTD